MRTAAEFEQFYQTSLRPVLEDMEAIRKKTVSRVLLTGAISLILALLIFIGFATTGNKGNGMYILIVVCLAGGVGIYSIIAGRYKADFKTKLIGPMISFFDPGLRYDPDGCILEEEFASSGVFRHAVDRYNGHDLVEGILGKTAVRFSEVEAEYKTESRDSKGNRETKWHTIFKGLFFVGDFNKRFSGTTYVLPDTAQRLFGPMGQALQSLDSSHGQLVKMEDPEFERAFVVHSSDQIEARYILSPALMRRILDFKNTNKRAVHIGFADSCVYLALELRKEMFAPKLFSTLLDPAVVHAYWNDLNLATGIVEDLNLNTRIWTKE